MFLAPPGVKSVIRVLPAVLLTLVVSLRGEAATVPASIAALDSLTGDSTIAAGRVVYVDFWASWCVPCRQSFPWMGELVARYGGQGLQVIAINVDRDRAAADKFLKDHAAPVHIVYDPSGKLAKLYQLEVMPSSFVYARDGTLKMRKEGFNAGETESVEALLRKLLAEEPKK